MRVALHHLDLAVEGEAPALAAAAELLGGFPPSAATGEPALAVRLRRAPPAPRPAGAQLFFHGVVRCFADGEDLLLWDGGSLARVAAGGRRVELAVADASLEDPYLFAHVFLLIALVLALRWHGLFHLHAGALVAPDGRGLLVVGGAGAGKSTLTVALLEQGCSYLGDDAVLVQAEGPRLLAFPRAFHLTRRSAAPFPRVLAHLADALSTGEKRRLDAGLVWPGRARSAMGAPWRILLTAIGGGAETSIEPADPAEAFGALVESSALVVVDSLPGARAQLEALRGLADPAQALHVHLGKDLLERPALAGRLLE